MKGFKKLALVSAIAAMPMSGFAMEAMDDSSLSAVTGQDGISISLGTDIAADIIIHDKDGYAGNYTGAGAIVLQGFSLALGGNNVTVDIDAGAQAAGDAVLNIAVTTPANMVLTLGNLQVAASNGASTTGNWGLDGAATTVANLGSMTLGSTSLNIQLGAEPQGYMILSSATITGGVSLANFALNDANSGGAISMTNLSIFNSGGTDLNVTAGVDATATGLVIDVTQFGDAVNGADLRITDLVLGGGAAIGDVEITGLDLTGTITVSGK
ncbi:MAG: hypothetical protein KAG82_05240 [Alcanivoracaceae bacterium]|nr:hypothetical protein [Alcanivoracaceae bacterium]